MAAELTDEQIKRVADRLWEMGEISSMNPITAVTFARAILALATQPPAQGAEPECFGLRFPSDHKLCLSTIFDTEEEAKDYCDQCSPGTVVVPLYTSPPPTAEVEPAFWYRPRSDGGYEGPLHHSIIEDVRKRSGAWVPLYTASTLAAEVKERLHTFLDAAAGDGFVMGGVDAGDLYAEVFPDRYAAALQSDQAQAGKGE